MICPFLSNPDGISSNPDKLYPCIGSCALLVGKECSIKLLAEAQYKIAKDLSAKNDKP